MTYKNIQTYVKRKFNRSIKTGWIAHVKEVNGLHPKIAPNRHYPKRKHPCPDWAKTLIEDAMKHYEMIL